MAKSEGQAVHVDERDFVVVDGIKIGRRVRGSDGQVRLQICDKDRRRSERRGTRFVEVDPGDLAEALEEKP